MIIASGPGNATKKTHHLRPASRFLDPLNLKKNGSQGGVMDKTRYIDEQIVKFLSDADSAPAAEGAQEHGVSEATMDARRKHYGRVGSTDVKWLWHRETIWRYRTSGRSNRRRSTYRSAR